MDMLYSNRAENLCFLFPDLANYKTWLPSRGTQSSNLRWLHSYDASHPLLTQFE